MNKRIALILSVTALLQFLFLFWMRWDFHLAADKGVSYDVPISVDFSSNFYEKNYISLNVPVTKAQWQGANPPARGETMYIAVGKDAEGIMYVKWAQLQPPSGDYITVRAEGYEGGVVYFHFPMDRLYMTADDLQKIPVSELAERVRVKNPETGRIETRPKNTITGRFRLYEGRAVFTDILVNGVSVHDAFTTVGVNKQVTYAVSGKTRDMINGVPQKEK